MPDDRGRSSRWINYDGRRFARFAVSTAASYSTGYRWRHFCFVLLCAVFIDELKAVGLY